MIMASDDLSDEERELIAEHRATRKPSRSVKISGKLESGAAYEFDAAPDEAERIIRRHPELAEPEDDGDPEGKPAVRAVKDEPGRRFGGRRVS
jgi:hypothetical protein